MNFRNLSEDDRKRMNEVDILTENIKEQKKIHIDKNKHWKGSKYEDMVMFEKDEVGRIGENTFRDLCGYGGIPYKYDGDKNINTPDGTYDIKIGHGGKSAKVVEENMSRIENKTSRKSCSGSHQHDGMGVEKGDNCDYYVFIDIIPNGWYLTIVPRKSFSLEEKHQIFDKKVHRRDEGKGPTKFDFSNRTIGLGLEAGVTMYITKDTKNDEIVDFIKSKIN